MAEGEIELAGGNTNQVMRKGDVVYRQPQNGSKAVEALLLHLQNNGFLHAPRFLGRDENGREMLTFIEGADALKGNSFLSETVLRQSVKALRLFHDLTAQFDGTAYDWQFSYPDTARHQTICHNDYGPYNLIVENGQLAGIIDFDLCGPGPRVRDVAYLAYWMAPLSFAAQDLVAHTQVELDAGCPRLHLICDTYGGLDVLELVEMVVETLTFMGSFDEMQNLFGNVTAQRLLDEGHLRHWQNEAQAFAKNQARVLAAFQQNSRYINQDATEVEF